MDNVDNQDLQLDINKIMKLLPHRYPFLLIDRVIKYKEWHSLTAIKNVTINEPFFTGHFTNYPIMPGVLIVESLAQATGLLVLNSTELPKDELYMLTSIEEAKFKKPVIPGDQLTLFVEYIKSRKNLIKLKGTASVDGKVACEAVLTCVHAKVD